MKVSKKQQQREEQGAAAEGEDMDAAVAGAGKGEGEEGCSGEATAGGTVVVGVRADAESRALLTWALVNVAATGDRVVAVHVVLAPGAEVSAAVDFDAMLAVYEGFCNLKQINLKVKICKDSSVRKALVREAVLFGASKVVLGISKKKRAISSSLSVAKYCAKKLPAKCAVLAVNSGKIVYRREANAHSGKISAELPGCGDDEMYCVLPFRARQVKEDTLPCGDSKDGGNGVEGQHDVGTKGSQPEDVTSEEQQPSSMKSPELLAEQVQSDANRSDKGEESTAHQKDGISELPGDGASVLYCVLSARNDASAASTSNRQDNNSADLPPEGDGKMYCLLPPRNGNSGRSSSDSRRSTLSQKDDNSANLSLDGEGELYCRLPSKGHSDRSSGTPEGDGEMYCLLPPRNGNSGRSSSDSRRSTLSQKDDNSANLSPDGEGELYCRLPSKGHSDRSSGRSKRSIGAKGVIRAIRHSSSFSSDIQLNAETSGDKRDGSVCATERSSSTASTEAGGSLKDAARNVETPSSSPLSLRRMIEGRSDRCRLRRRIFNHERSSSFEWARVSMVQWAMRLPSRYSSVHPDSKSSKSDASPRLNCDSESEFTSVVESESMFSFSLYDVAWPPSELESLQEKYSSVCRLFSYKELKLATSNFSPDMLIGKGGTSQVYKALLDDMLYAVKILKPSVDALHEFVTEIDTVTGLQHENIVSLRGFSFDNYSLVLVYDYMHQGSLDKALHGKGDGQNVLIWEKRNNIAIDIAKGLEFLHHGSVTQSVIHGDVKSANILLSENFQAQLCDFGLAKQVSASTPHLTCTDITGTFGYLAPEYFSYGKVNDKIDVYAFGVVLLEIISGRKPIITGCVKGQESLVGWARPLLSSGEITQLIDPFLGNDYDCDEMERMTLAASLCTRTSSHSRPETPLVVKLLQGDDEAVHWARSQVSAGSDVSDEEAATNPGSNMQSHLNLALLGVEEDDTLSRCSTEQTSADGYWSRSSSFD